MATKKKLGNSLKVGDRFVLPKETVEITGKADIPYAVVSEEKGTILAFKVKQTSGPLKGNEFSVIVLGDGKVEYVLKDPVLVRATNWLKAQLKDIFTPAPKKPEPKITTMRGADTMMNGDHVVNATYKNGYAKPGKANGKSHPIP